MPHYRRARVAGAMYFFTVVTHRRQPLFAEPAARALLGSIMRQCLLRQPFQLVAIVLLPDHLHAIWSLPSGDADYSRRWSWIKGTFTVGWLQLGSDETNVTGARRNERRRGVWQPRFWEHTLESEEDFERHFDYIHYNPVKHGYVACPSEWSPSSFHRWVSAGVYPSDWACSGRRQEEMAFADIVDTVGE